MHLLFRFLAALTLLAAPIRALTVAEMKAMEVKVKAVIAKNTPAVVSLMGKKVPGAGSGTVVSADGLILTAAHVTQGNDSMTVLFPDGGSVDAKVLGADYERDVSLVKIEKAGKYPFAEMGDSDKLEATSMVIAMGHPGGFDVRRSPPVRIGRISTSNQGGFLVSDCTLIGGDSGGPLFDLDGRVVGVHSSISESLSFNRSAPVNAAKTAWERMLKGERWGTLGGPLAEMFGRGGGKRAVLGAVTDPTSTNGAALIEVQPQSPLEGAGLKAGDVIFKLAGREVKTAGELNTVIREKKPGDKIEVAWRRDGAEMKADVTLISQREMLQRLGGPPRNRRKQN